MNKFKSGLACKSCGSSNIIDEVVDFCGDCRSYDIDIRDENGIFYTDTEQYQLDIKNYKIKKELDEKEKKKQEQITIKNTLEMYPKILQKMDDMYKLQEIYRSELNIFKFNIPTQVPQDISKKIKDDMFNLWHYNFAEYQGRIKNNEYIKLEEIEQRFNIFQERILNRLEEVVSILVEYKVFSREKLDIKLNLTKKDFS